MLKRNRLLVALVNLPEIVGGALLLALCLDVLVGIVSRSFIGRSVPWSEELARYLFVWVSLLGAAIAVKRRQHFSFDLAIASLSPRLRRLIHVLVVLAIVAFSLLMVGEGMNIVMATREQVSVSMSISVAWLYLSAPVSGALMLVYVAAQALERARQTRPELRD